MKPSGGDGDGDADGSSKDGEGADVVTTGASDIIDVITLDVGIFTFVRLEVGAATIGAVAEEYKHNFE